MSLRMTIHRETDFVRGDRYERETGKRDSGESGREKECFLVNSFGLKLWKKKKKQQRRARDWRWLARAAEHGVEEKGAAWWRVTAPATEKKKRGERKGAALGGCVSAQRQARSTPLAEGFSWRTF